MNAKGGVGKSTLTAAIAETLSASHRLNVLVVDADGQMSLSLMCMAVDRLAVLGDERTTLVGWLSQAALHGSGADWRHHVVGDASDIDDARSVYLMAGDMDLPLLEREAASQQRTGHVRGAIRTMLDEAKALFDVVLVDCAPGLSVMTETFLRECDHHIVPVKPDLLAVAGMQYLKRFRARDRSLGWANHLGIVVNMKHLGMPLDETIHQSLLADPSHACFTLAIPWVPHVQKASLHFRGGRSFQNKYPGEFGRAIRLLVDEILVRVSGGARPVALVGGNAKAASRV